MYPPIETFDHGLLPVGDGNTIYWEASGSPNGKPALYLHGGPGSGLGKGGYRRRFDPDKYLIIGLDQRGCGRSTPLAVNALEALSSNTTQTLIEDLEKLRTHLCIPQWLVAGVSWGTTLALAYAQAHPARVSEIVLTAVTTTSREEVDWITDTVGRIFPEAWQALDEASNRRPDERLIEAMVRRLTCGSASERMSAAAAWDAWEATHVSLDPHWQPGPVRSDPVERANFATLVTHYWANDAFLRETSILSRMDLISHIPAVLIHGRHDISGPSIIPWRLHHRWPGSKLHIVESEGHGGPISMQLTCDATDSFLTNDGGCR